MQKERMVGGGVLVLGLMLFFVLIPSGIDSPGEVDHMTLSPDFWPRIISIMFAPWGCSLSSSPVKYRPRPKTQSTPPAGRHDCRGSPWY